MKKISVFALLAAMVLPAIAEDVAESVKTAVEPVATVAETVNTETTPVANDAKVIAEESQATEESQVANTETETVVADIKEPVVAVKSKTSFPHGLQIGVGLSGTSGLNGFIGYANKNFDSFWAKRFGVRFDFGTMSPIKSKVNNVINDVIGDELEIGDNLAISNVALQAEHYAAMVDFYPFGNTWFLGGWRLTGGYYFGEMNINAKIAGTIDELDSGVYEFELMDTQFRYLGNSVNGSAELNWNYRGPYLGTGFDFGLIAGFKIYLDAGVVFTNKAAQLSLNVPFDNLEMLENGSWETVKNTSLEDVVNDIVSDTLADAQSELDDLKFYPMVKVGFMYRF